MSGNAEASPRGRGRPRDPALDDRILEQTLVLLGSHGYAGLTLDELAARSGVAKTTVLRRWPSKAAVAAAGVERLALQSVAVPRFGHAARRPARAAARRGGHLRPRPRPVRSPAAPGGR